MDTAWLVGASGLYSGAPNQPGQAIGGYSFSVNAIVQTEKGLVLASDTGLWLVPNESDRWFQLHDETMTSALGVASTPVGLGVVVASAYGVATGEMDALGVPRWMWYSDDLPVNARYSNVVMTDPNDSLRWLVGTEAGVLVYEYSAKKWVHTSLMGRPVRGLCWAHGAFWAGADNGGIWKSEEGVTWAPAGHGLDATTVYAIAGTKNGLIAGLEGGIAVGDGNRRWEIQGPKIRTRAVAAQDDVWLAGANPGGLWWSSDEGQRWQKTGDFRSVRIILAREG